MDPANVSLSILAIIPWGLIAAGKLKTDTARKAAKQPAPAPVPLSQLLFLPDQQPAPAAAQARSPRNPGLAAAAAARTRDPDTGQFKRERPVSEAS